MAIRLSENFRALFYAPFYAAHAIDAYHAEGVDVTLLPSPDPARTAIALRAVRVVHAGPDGRARPATMRWKSPCKASTPKGPLRIAVSRPSGPSTKMAPE